jgi:hypothetical protein
MDSSAGGLLAPEGNKWPSFHFYWEYPACLLYANKGANRWIKEAQLHYLETVHFSNKYI